MESIYQSTTLARKPLHDCVSLVDDTSIAPAQRIRILASLIPLLPDLGAAHFLYLGRHAISLLHDHLRERAAQAASGQVAMGSQAQALAAAAVHDVMIVCAAFPALSDLAWVYSPTEPLTASQVQAQEAKLRRHLRDLDELLSLRRPALSTPGSAPATPSPLRLLGNLMQALYETLSAPLHAALALLPAPVAGQAAIPPGPAVNGSLALLLQADPPEEAARLDRK